MNIKRLAVVLLSLFFLSIFLSPVCYSQQNDEKNKKLKMLELYKLLKLSDIQKKELLEIRNRYKVKREELGFEIKKERFMLADMLRNEKTSEEDVYKQLEVVMSLETDKQKLMMEEYYEVIKKLNPDQKRIYTQNIVRAIIR